MLTSPLRKHILSDLQPYVCVVTNCGFTSDPFPDRRAWRHHLELEHGLDDPLKNLECPLCQENLVGHSKTSHLARHLEEISLTILPANAEESDDDESDRDSEDELGENAATGSVPRLHVQLEEQEAETATEDELLNRLNKLEGLVSLLIEKGANTETISLSGAFSVLPGGGAAPNLQLDEQPAEATSQDTLQNRINRLESLVLSLMDDEANTKTPSPPGASSVQSGGNAASRVQPEGQVVETASSSLQSGSVVSKAGPRSAAADHTNSHNRPSPGAEPGWISDPKFAEFDDPVGNIHPPSPGASVPLPEGDPDRHYCSELGCKADFEDREDLEFHIMMGWHHRADSPLEGSSSRSEHEKNITRSHRCDFCTTFRGWAEFKDLARHVCQSHPEEALKNEDFKKIIWRCTRCRNVMLKDNLRRHYRTCVGDQAVEGSSVRMPQPQPQQQLEVPIVPEEQNPTPRPWTTH